MKGNIKQRVSFLVISVLTVFSLSVLASATSMAADTIKIGTIMPISGPLSIVGMTWTRGFEMFADQQNRNGGITIKGKNYRLKLITEDSKANQETAKASALKLVYRDKVNFVMGGIMEPVIAAINKVCQKDKLLFASTNANIPGHPADVSPDKKYQVRLFISHDDTHTIDLDYLKQTYPSVKTIGIGSPDVGYDGMMADFEKKANARGMKVISEEKFQFGTTDFIPLYTKILSKKPDAILAMVSGQAQYQLMAARQLGFDGVFISNSPLAPEVFLAVAGPQDCDKLIVNAANTQDNTPKIKEVIKLWNEKYKEPFVGDSLYGYDALWVLMQAVEKAQSLKSEDVLAALDASTHLGDLMTTHGQARMGGKARFGVNRTLIRPIALTRLEKGKIADSRFIMP